MLNKEIESRTVTPLGVSVGTGIALETIFDIDPFDKARVLPDRTPAKEFKTHIYNIYTLYRNVINSIPFKDKDQLIASKLVKDELLNDIYLIKGLYDDMDSDVVFYLPNYSSLYNKFNKGKDGDVYKPYIAYKFMEENIKRLQFPGNVYKGTANGELPRLTDNVLILTHFTVDLLNIDRIPNLHLLESHTGKLTTKTSWGKKYHPIGKRDLTMLPMHRKILYLLGDKTLVKPTVIGNRRALYKNAAVRLWTPVSSKTFIDKEITKFDKNIPV